MNVRIIMLSFLPLPGPFSSPVGTVGFYLGLGVLLVSVLYYINLTGKQESSY